MTYQLNNQKWGEPIMGTDSGVVYYTLDLSGLDYDTSLYTEADLYAAAMDAFQAWEDVADIDFEPAPAGVDVDIEVTTGLLQGSVVGTAWWTTWGSNTGTWEYADARLTMDTEPTWSPYGETGTSLYAVMLHEIGHVIGLDHVDDPTEIMNPYIATNDLGDGDIAGVQEIYGDDTVIAGDPTTDPTPDEPTTDPAPDDPTTDPTPEEPAPDDPVKGGGKGNGHGGDKGNGPDKTSHPGNGKKSLAELQDAPDETEPDRGGRDAENGPDPKGVDLADLIPMIDVANANAPVAPTLLEYGPDHDHDHEHGVMSFADLC